MSTHREYETTYILAPLTDAAERAKVTERVSNVITNQFGGTILRTDDWGRRELAYDVQKHRQGLYVYNRYTAPATAITELERVLRLMDPVIKFLTVRLEEGAASDARPDMVRAAPIKKDDEDEEDED